MGDDKPDSLFGGVFKEAFRLTGPKGLNRVKKPSTAEKLTGGKDQLNSRFGGKGERWGKSLGADTNFQKETVGLQTTEEAGKGGHRTLRLLVESRLGN